jgi:hypothetical protein
MRLENLAYSDDELVAVFGHLTVLVLRVDRCGSWDIICAYKKYRGCDGDSTVSPGSLLGD